MHDFQSTNRSYGGLRASVCLALVTALFGCRDQSTAEPPKTEVPPSGQLGQSQPVSEAVIADLREVDDAGITRAVEHELLLDHLTPAQAIVVTTTDGIVELTGTVDNLLAKRRATKIAEVVRGVRAVSNRMTIAAKDLPDAELVGNIHDALLYDPVTESYEIAVSAKHGAVTLTGTVGSWAEREIAEHVTESVAGVNAVTNDIAVRYESERPDLEISREIERRLATDVLVDHDQLEVSVVDGVVTLSGVVGSLAERTRAESLAWTAGVKSVSGEEIEVNYLEEDTNLRKQTFTLESESEIADALRGAMFYDPRVDSFDITPVVHGSTVTLVGTVDNLRAKQAAAQLAHNTVGVARVVNDIIVKPGAQISDKDAATAILEQLQNNVYTNALDIQVDVADGVANLTGTVDNYFEKAAAGDIASRARGILEVNNLLQVEHTEYGFYYDPYFYMVHPYVEIWDVYRPTKTVASDVEITDAIDDQLFWSPFVDASQVHVSVTNGTATLTGTVDTWREREAAGENAYKGGALYVNNLLHVGL